MLLDIQQEVLHMYKDGKNINEIAEKFNISYHTVNFHLQLAIQKTSEKTQEEIFKRHA